MRLLLVVFLLVSLASVAQESAEYRACLDKATIADGDEYVCERRRGAGRRAAE